MANEFLVSVADVIGRDATTDALLFLGKANISSAFQITTQKTDVRGGINNPLLYSYYHDREVSIKIESATFNKAIIALNAGTTVSNSTYTVAKKESLTLSGGSVTLTETPTSSTVGVILPDGTIQNLTPVGAVITVSGGLNQTVDCIYDYSETLVDQIVGYATLPPTGIHLTLMSEVRNASNTKTYDLVIDVPNFNLSGNYTMSLNANGVSSDNLEGTSVVESSTGGDYYYKVWWIPAAATSLVYTDIAATPSTVTFDVSDLPDTAQITVLGIRGGLMANTNVTTSCSFVRTSGCTTISVGATSGLITASSAVLADSTCVITATYWSAASGSLTDTMNVAATA